MALSSATRAATRLPPSLSLYRPEQPMGDDDDEPPQFTLEPKQSRAKSNSERGKEFRAKRKKYEGELETAVYKLRSHIAELDVRKSVWEKQLLDARHTASGSLAHLIREYFALFRYGLHDVAVPPTATTGTKRALVSVAPGSGVTNTYLDKIRRQEAFISSIMDTDVLVGEKSGPSASMAQWRMYTISHNSLRNEPYRIITSGSEEHPCIEVHTNIYGRISRDTIRYIFPGALHEEALIQKFLHHEVVYKSIFRFQFTDSGKIAMESADINIVEGLQAAGFDLDDLSQLMQQAVITPQCMIPEPDAKPLSPPSRPARQGSPPSSSKLSLGFLLGIENHEPHSDEQVCEIVP